MVRVIMGKRGSGKTKAVIDLVHQALEEESGNVVCIEKGTNLRYNVKYHAKLIDVSEYNLNEGYDSLYSYICGVYSGNYDITHIFLDSMYKMANDDDPVHAADFLDRLDKLSEMCGIKFTITISADKELATDRIKKYFIS